MLNRGVNVFNRKIYAAKLKDVNALAKSSSGGAFRALSEQWILEGNAVVCTRYDYETQQVVFGIVSTIEGRDNACGSKYVQADMNRIYNDSVVWLRENPEKRLMFIGMGCQAAAFQNYMRLEGLLNRVVILDIICHGVPSPLIWEEYANLVCNGQMMTYVNFRDKISGWSHSRGTAVIGERTVSIQEYRRMYTSRNPIRPSCFNCPYTKIERNVDITIGDFWHIEDRMPDFYDPMGVSLIIVHSQKGMELFDKARTYIEYRESNEKDCWQLNLEKPTPVPDSREMFWTDYREKGISFVVKKYGKPKSFPKRLAAKMKTIVNGS